MNPVKIRRALLSVSDKTGIIELARSLQKHKIEIVSTGGTAQALTQAGISIIPIESITGNPEAFGGRMKTISFQVGSALLYQRNLPEDVRQASELGIQGIDLVVCNLYPFERDPTIENIDIGGPTMIRAAAKNAEHVVCLVSPDQYAGFIQELDLQQGATKLESRRQWALTAFQRIAAYDLTIAYRLSHQWGEGTSSHLRYGENPHQPAAFLPFQNSMGSDGHFERGWGAARVLQGKEISYNNWLDADSAWKCTSDLAALFPEQSVVTIVKHGNPCGVAVAPRELEALTYAWNADSVSAFGGVLAFSKPLTLEQAQFLSERFVEVVIAPGFSAEARQILNAKKNLRLIESALREPGGQEWTARTIWGGMLCQAEDQIAAPKLKLATRLQFNSKVEKLVPFAWTVTRYLKSNCIGLFTQVGDVQVTLASGTGQPNRLDCIRLLIQPRIQKLSWNPENTLLVSDAFFPFRDSIDAIREIGIHYVVQPGGSVRDAEVIQACDDAGIAMGFSGIRTFRH